MKATLLSYYLHPPFTTSCSNTPCKNCTVYNIKFAVIFSSVEFIYVSYYLAIRYFTFWILPIPSVYKMPWLENKHIYPSLSYICSTCEAVQGKREREGYWNKAFLRSTFARWCWRKILCSMHKTLPCHCCASNLCTFINAISF